MLDLTFYEVRLNYNIASTEKLEELISTILGVSLFLGWKYANLSHLYHNSILYSTKCQTCKNKPKKKCNTKVYGLHGMLACMCKTTNVA